MFANLSAVILYVWAIKNNYNLLLIIPTMILIRNLVLLTPDGSMSRRIAILSGVPVKIEYYISVVSALLMLFYLLAKKYKPKMVSQSTFITIFKVSIALLSLLLAYNIYLQV